MLPMRAGSHPPSCALKRNVRMARCASSNGTVLSVIKSPMGMILSRFTSGLAVVVTSIVARIAQQRMIGLIMANC